MNEKKLIRKNFMISANHKAWLEEMAKKGFSESKLLRVILDEYIAKTEKIIGVSNDR